MSKEVPTKLFNKFIFEIRYKPNPKVLDFRGLWSESITTHMELREFRISEDRVDVYDKDAKNRAFLGFSNSGFITNDVPSKNYFPDQALKFFKFVLGLPEFGSPIFVTRLGVRSKFYAGFGGEFDDLLNRYTTRFFNVDEKAKEIMSAQIIDIGGAINFKGKDYNINTSHGPMKAVQASQFLERNDALADVGLYLDLDCWKTPQQQLDDTNIFQFITNSSRESWDKFERIENLILKD